MFTGRQKINSSLTFSLRHYKILKTCYLGYFGHAQRCTPKVILSTCRKLSCLSAGKKSSMFFWRYCKATQTSYLGYFGHAWLHKSKMILSTCRRLQCLFACQKINIIINFFLEILQFKECCNLISQ